MPDRNIPRDDLIARADAVSAAVRELIGHLDEFRMYEEETREQEEATHRLAKWAAAGVVLLVIVCLMLGVFVDIAASNRDRIARSQETQYHACLAANQRTVGLRDYIVTQIDASVALLQKQQHLAPLSQKASFDQYIAFDRQQEAQARVTFAPSDCAKLPH